MKDQKYLAAYSVPAITVFSLLSGGIMSFATVIYVFVFIPLMEPLLGSSAENHNKEVQASMLKNKLFDWLLYLNAPIIFGVLGLLFYQLNTQELSNLEYTGFIISTGLVLGACGINVAHELGHRQTKGEQLLAKIMLIPSLYMHFFIEHNRGHHKNIATDLDPASARKGEILYFFWFKSVVFSYISAWKLESKRLKQIGKSFWSIKNEMLIYSFVQGLYLVILGLFSNNFAVWAGVVGAGIISFLLLETINYVEHYGLRRKKLPSGRYERVRPKHSWNSDLQLGRIILYELTRHSDHHFLATRKYQILEHHEEAPELPVGYPTSMLLALVPPLWFYVMNRRIPA